MAVFYACNEMSSRKDLCTTFCIVVHKRLLLDFPGMRTTVIVIHPKQPQQPVNNLSEPVKLR